MIVFGLAEEEEDEDEEKKEGEAIGKFFRCGFFSQPACTTFRKHMSVLK